MKKSRLMGAVVIACITITGCSTTKYVWKNSDTYKSNDAQYRKDEGECTMIAYQSVPATPPQAQNINQTVTVNTYPYGRNESYGETGIQQSLNQYSQRNHERHQQQQAQQQMQRQQIQLEKARDDVSQACMASKGWYKEYTN